MLKYVAHKNEYNGTKYYYNTKLRLWVITGCSYNKSFNTELELLEYIDEYGGEVPESKDLYEYLCHLQSK